MSCFSLYQRRCFCSKVNHWACVGIGKYR